MKQTPTTKVFIIVPNQNGWRDTIECLNSLRRLDHPHFRMVVVDNGSDDNSADHIEHWAAGSRAKSRRATDGPLLTVSYNETEVGIGGTDEGEVALAGFPPYEALVLVRLGANLGFAGACNIGIRYALKNGADYIWLLNNDTVVSADCLSRMVETARSTDSIGAVGSVLRYHHDPGSVQAYGGGSICWWSGTTRHFTGPAEGEPDYLTGASMLLDRRAVEDVGLLDESYFFYWEDIAYCQRLLRAGWRIRVADDACILHKEGATVGGGPVKSLDSDRFMMAGMVRFFVLRGGVRWPLAIAVRIAGMVVNRLRRGQGGRVPPLLKVAGDALGDALREKGWFRRVGP